MLVIHLSLGAISIIILTHLKGTIMNTITILTPEPLVVDYASMLDVQLAIGKAGLGNMGDAEAMAANKSIYIEVPEGTPKNRLSELDTIVKTFNFAGLTVDEGAEWEKGAFGSKVDWSEDEPLIHRGVDVSNVTHCKLVRDVIEMFQDATAAWKELKADGVVAVDGNFHIKTLAKFRKSRGKK